MNILKPHKKLAILSGLLEGCSARSVSRMTGSHLETVLKVLVNTGQHCDQILDERIRGIRCEAVECDELWSFVQKKQRRLTDDDKFTHPEYGDAYTFVGLDPATKLVVSYLVGKRDTPSTNRFMEDLSQRIDGEVQISTDGFHAYVRAIQNSFGYRATHGEIVKIYAAINPGPGRYSPAQVAGITKTNRWGIPDPKKVCTSYVERNNLTMRCHIRRMTRLTNGFSKKLANLKAAVSLWFCYYNFCRIHGSLKITPAMEAGLTNSVWKLEEIMA